MMEVQRPVDRSVWCIALVAILALVIGCGSEAESELAHGHSHDQPKHTPVSLMDLSSKIRARLVKLEESPDDTGVQSEIADLIGWSAEIAADTEVEEAQWLPIYKLSESLRLSIADEPALWDAERCRQASQLCQLAEEAWQSLPVEQQVERYSGHDHGHGDHGHDHGDHGTHDHDHGDHGHDHDHGAHDHDHDHGDHEHDHGDHGDES